MKHLILSLLVLAWCCSSAHAGIFSRRTYSRSDCADGNCAKPAEKPEAKAADVKAADVKAPAKFTIPVMLSAEAPATMPGQNAAITGPFDSLPPGEYIDLWMQSQANKKWFLVKFRKQ